MSLFEYCENWDFENLRVEYVKIERLFESEISDFNTYKTITIEHFIDKYIFNDWNRFTTATTFDEMRGDLYVKYSDLDDYSEKYIFIYFELVYNLISKFDDYILKHDLAKKNQNIIKNIKE